MVDAISHFVTSWHRPSLSCNESCDGSGTPVRRCSPTRSPTGEWIMLQSCVSCIKQTIELTYGVSTTDSTERTTTWSREVTAKVSAGLSFGGFNAGVEGSYSTTAATSSAVSRSVTQTRETKKTFEYGPGVAWQFVLKVEDTCGEATVWTDIVEWTNARAEEPCCLPDYFRDPTKVHGPCRQGDGYERMCACGPAICAPGTSRL
jgi:hypothetical protein